MIVGGTFDRLHKGHKILLKTAAAISEEIFVGLADGPLLAGKRGREKIASFEERRKILGDYLSGLGVRFEIARITDPVGPASEDDRAEAIVASEETYPGALLVNEERAKSGRAQLPIVVIPTILADDGRPISSSRIRMGEIDPEGRILTGRGGR